MDKGYPSPTSVHPAVQSIWDFSVKSVCKLLRKSPPSDYEKPFGDVRVVWGVNKGQMTGYSGLNDPYMTPGGVGLEEGRSLAYIMPVFNNDIVI